MAGPQSEFSPDKRRRELHHRTIEWAVIIRQRGTTVCTRSVCSERDHPVRDIKRESLRGNWPNESYEEGTIKRRLKFIQFIHVTNQIMSLLAT